MHSTEEGIVILHYLGQSRSGSDAITFKRKIIFFLPKAKPAHKVLRHWRSTLHIRAAVHRGCQRPPKGLGTNETGNDMTSKHARKHEARPPRLKKREKRKRFPSRLKRFGLFLLANATGPVIKETHDITWVTCYKHTAIWAPVKNCPLADSFSRPMA